MFIEFNPNPKKKLVDDCVIRAICLVTGKDWYTVRTELFLMRAITNGRITFGVDIWKELDLYSAFFQIPAPIVLLSKTFVDYFLMELIYLP